YDNESVAPGGTLNADGGGINQGGSMARFSLSGDQLYTLSSNEMTNFDISNPEKITSQGSTMLEWGAETLFPYNNHMFVGTMTGMLIYDLSDPANPKFVNRYEHVRACDPVVVQGNTAYVTIRNGTNCGGVNELHILDISDYSDIRQMAAYPMAHPHGLGVDGDNLFLCDGYNGLKVFDVSDPININQINHLEIGNTYDIIPYSQLAIVVGSDKLIQYAYDSDGQMTELSSIIRTQ
ncbi:MAG: hypothetical protein WBH03_19170, partial [Cyclobacteriaceae bacterium]